MDEEDGPEGEVLAQAVWEVYGVPPAEFVPTRTRWVTELRSRRQRETASVVAALRKPSVSAAAINALVHAEDPVVDRLRDVGTRLRHAQSALDGHALAGLRGERDGLLHDWVSAAADHAPGRLTGAAEAEVRDTAVAALADGAATEVALSGTLTRALSYSGFGEVDVSDAVARTSTGVVLTRIEGGRPSRTKVAEEAEDTGDAGDSESAGVSDDTDDDAHREDHPDPGAAVAAARLREELAEAEERVSTARRARRAAQDTTETTAARAEAAEEALARARDLVARAEEESQSVAAAQEEARAALAEADATLVAARELRDRARAALEEAEDCG